MTGNNPARYTYWHALSVAFTRMIVRQFRFPPLLRGIVEMAAMASVFLVAGYISLGAPLVSMLTPMVPVVALMSGVYREEITHSIINLYIHSLYGFALATVGFLLMTHFLPSEYSSPTFIFFFLFFSFFVMNTIRPLISGTDFMDGGGRRIN